MTSFVDMLFANEPGHMLYLAHPMPYRYLLGPVFRGSHESATFHPQILRRFLKLYLQRWLRAESFGDVKREKELFDRGVDTLDAQGWPDGLAGMDNLDRLASIFFSSTIPAHAEAEIRVGLTRTIFRLARYGAYLGIGVVDQEGKDAHGHVRVVTEVLESFTKRGQGEGCALVPFINCLSFNLPNFFVIPGDRRLHFDVTREVKEMQRFIPTFSWLPTKGLAPMLVKDFLVEDQARAASYGQDGVCIAKYGPVNVWVKMCTRLETDTVRRRGMILEGSDTSITFDPNAADQLQMEYFVRTSVAPSGLSPVDHDIDYGNEQRLIWEVARKLYAGLYDRDYENRVRVDTYALKLRYSEQLGQKLAA